MPGQVFFKNFLGIPQSDFELLMVPYPRTELTAHITIKTIQTGTLLGSVGGGLYSLIRSGGAASGDEVCSAATTSGLYGAGVGLLLGPALTYLSTRNNNDVQIYDRCYRLRFNRMNLFADRLTLVSAVVGAAALGPPGFVAGVDLGVLFGTYFGSKLR